MDKSVINWKKVNKKPRSDFDRNINNNAAIGGCKEMGLKMIGLGGTDITKGIKKSIIAVCWQLFRISYLNMIGDKKESEIVKWANDLVGGRSPNIKDFKD